MKTLDRSFGFDFRNLLLNGTLQQSGKNELEIYIIYDNKEYESFGEFVKAIQPTQPEQDELLEKINKLIKLP